MVRVANERRRRIAWIVLAGAVPATLLGVGVINHILNHFYTRAPYLLDAGWYSAIVNRAGLIPDNPVIACGYAASYYGIHFSPFVSAMSIVSYAVPLDRVHWYAVVQALVYTPAGIAVGCLFGTRSAGSVVIASLAAIAFALCGQVLYMIGYPHYEAAIPGLICVVIASVVNGRIQTAWVFVALAVSVREDAGLHLALALGPLVYLSWRGVELAVTRRTLVTMCGVAVGATVVGIACQRLVFHSFDLLRAEFLGTPLFSHLSVDLLLQRLDTFIHVRQVFYYPFVATVIVAVLLRDARVLLGWAATLPWFVVNLTAVQGAKGEFFGYTGFPFLVAMFWVLVYCERFGPLRVRGNVGRVLFALAVTSSTLGYYRGEPREMTAIVHDMRVGHHSDVDAIDRVVDLVEHPPASLGRVFGDSAVAALAIEELPPDRLWKPDMTNIDTLAFHRDDSPMVTAFVANHLDACALIRGSNLVMCSRHGGELATALSDHQVAFEIVPPVFSFLRETWVRTAMLDAGIQFPAETHLVISLGTLPAGAYQIELRTSGADARVQVDDSSLVLHAGSAQTLAFRSTGSQIALRIDSVQAVVFERFDLTTSSR